MKRIPPFRAHPTKYFADRDPTFTRSGAALCARRIEDVWRANGYKVTARVVTYPDCYGAPSNIFGVVTDLVNGLPRRSA